MGEIATVNPNNALIIFDQHYTPATLFVPGTMDPLIDHIRKEVASEMTDPTTPAGRARIKSLAYKVTSTKTAIDTARKNLVSDEKKRLAAIDAEGRRVWDILEDLAKQVRKPVTDYEQREKDRIEGHRAAIEAIKALGQVDVNTPISDLESRLELLSAVGTDLEEFTGAAVTAKKAAVDALTQRIASLKQAEAAAAEAERARKEASEREQAEREARAAARAKAEAEEAARVREEEARKAAEAEQRRIRREAEEREAKIRAEAEAKERAASAELARVEREKTEAKEAAEKAKRDRIEAERKAEDARKAAKTEAERRQREAVEQERRRIESERKAEEDAARKREANRAHQAKVNNAAAAAFVMAGLSEDAAKVAVTAIAKGNVPGVKISY